MLLTVSHNARITGAPPNAARALRDRLTFPNPKYEENERKGFSTWNVPRYLCYLTQDKGSLAFPRGFTRQAIDILRLAKTSFSIDDQTRTLPSIDFKFTGELRDYQQQAVEATLKRQFGTLSASTGSGKTVMALDITAERQQPTLIIVHSQELAEQWIERIGEFLGIPAKDVGVIGGGKMRIGEKITVALVQSLHKCARKVAPHIGHLIIDECHKIPSRTFLEAVKAFDCRYMLGLSATPYRRDGLTSLIYLHLGDKVHEIDRRGLIDQGSIMHAEIITRETAFQSTVNPSAEYSHMLSELTQDQARNHLIVEDVAREAHNSDGVCLVLTDRTAHCETLARLLEEIGTEATILTGDLAKRKRSQIVKDINAGLVKVVVATGQLIGEGFDCKSLSTLFLASPVKFAGRLLQYLGRVLRPAPGKDKARVFDYVDTKVGVLVNAAKKRQRVYAQAA